MDSTDERNWILLEQYVAGELLPNDAVRIERWVATDRELQSYVALMRAARQRTNRPRHGWDASAAFGRALAQRGRDNWEAPLPSIRQDRIVLSPVQKFGRGFAPAFMTAVLLLAIGLGISRYAPSFTPRQGNSIAATIYSTRNAQRAQVTLVDGTEVSLNVASRLEVPAAFRTRNQNVVLQGGALFRVTHQTARPFTVSANGTHTRVLGTEFSILAYSSDSTAIAVQTGRVAVNGAILSAHEVAYVHSAGIPRITREQNLEPWTGFAAGRLVLDKVLLAQAVPALNRWYDVDIRLSDARLETYPINAVLLNGSMSELLEILRVTFDVNVVRDSRTITLYPR